MTDDEGALRKKRVRGAHRASVTRLVVQLEEALGGKDTHRLRQLRQSLTDKSDILVRLDNELLELVKEEELEAEVEQADQIKEKISLSIIHIDDALKAQEASHGGREYPQDEVPDIEPTPGPQPQVRRGDILLPRVA